MTDIKDLEKTLWTAADKMRSNMDAAESVAQRLIEG